MGNGSSIKIRSDSWLPQPTLYKPQGGKNLLGSEAKVKTLIQADNKEWNIPLIKVVFNSQEAELITQIPISLCGEQDQIMWRGNTHGDFTVMSTYHLQGELQDRKHVETSCKIFLQEDWTKLRKLPIPPATKKFLWRACRNILPTKINLVKKKILEDSICPMCLQAPETIEHILWECVLASEVLGSNWRKIQKCRLSQNNFKQIL